MMLQLNHAIGLLLLVGACGGSPNPQDTSVAEHERIARSHESAVAGSARACSDPRRSESGPPCWAAQDARVLAAHRNAAAEHRAASAALRDAEAKACVGLTDEDRDVSPLEHRADLAGVEPLVERISQGKGGDTSRDAGAIVTVRAVPGLTAEWLQRLVDCHVARDAALGHVVPEMPDCPLVPRGVVARVRSAGGGFAVEIRSDDPSTAREVLSRARRLVDHPPQPAVDHYWGMHML